MINGEKAKMYCCEDISKIYGYAEAVADKQNMWDCHHCLGLVYTKEELIKRGLYYNQPAEMLVFCTKSEHKKLHCITRSITEETRQKLSEAHKGKKLSKSTRNKMSSSRMGHIVSIETRNKISESQRGKIITEETKNKLSKPLLQFTLNGEFIAEYSSIKCVCEKYGYSKGNISGCCHGKQKTAYGFVWRFKD